MFAFVSSKTDSMFAGCKAQISVSIEVSNKFLKSDFFDTNIDDALFMIKKIRHELIKCKLRLYR